MRQTVRRGMRLEVERWPVTPRNQVARVRRDREWEAIRVVAFAASVSFGRYQAWWSYLPRVNNSVSKGGL